MQLTRASRMFKKAVSLPAAKTPRIAPRRARPVAAAPMQYKTNITLLAVFTALTPSSIADGHLRSVKLIPGLNSCWMTAVGLKWNKDVVFEQCVTFFSGCSDSLAIGEGV